MATPRDKFIELRKSGVDAQTARKQAYWDIASTPIANAPVAWQAPTITPITPEPVEPVAPIDNKAILAKNQAKVQAEIQAGTRPEVGQQATPEQVPQIVQQVQKPVEPVAPTPAPTPVAEVKPVETATDNQKAYDEMMKNADNGYNLAPWEKKLTERRINAERQPTDKRGILSALTTWQPVAPQNTPEYRKATAVHTAFQKFNGMSEQQLLDNIKQGQITTEMWWLLAQNPAYQLARKKADEIASTEATNKTIQGIKSGMTGKEITTPNYLEDISNELIKKFWLVDQSSQEAFKTIVSEDPEVVSYTKQLHDINRQVAETTEMLNKGYAEMKANYGDLTQSQIMNYMSSSFKWANDLLSTLNNTKSYLEADLKNATDMAVAEYGAKQADIQQMNSMRTQIFWQAVQSQFALASKLQEQSLADELAVQAQNDPTKAIPILIEQYAKLGVPMQRSTQAMIAEAQNVIANGWTLADYLTDLQGKIQGKPEYKRIQELQAWQMTDMEKMKASQSFELGKMWIEQDFQIKLANAKNVISWKWTKLDDWLYQDASGNIITADELKNAKLLGNSYITKDIWEEGGECGFYASRATGMSSTPWGNSKEARTKAFSETTPQVWGMAFFGWAWYDPTYWHISIVTWVNEDGTINVKDSNYAGDKKVDERTVPASSVTGYYNNTPLARIATGETEPEYDANALSIANWVWDLSDLTATDKKTILPQLEKIVNSRMTWDKSRDAIVKSALYKKDISDSTLQKITDMQTVRSQLDGIEARLANQDVWPFIGAIKKLNPYDTEAQVALAELAGITPKVARGIFWEVWVLTDTDIANYQKTIPNLTSTADKNKLVVEVMRKLLAKWVMNTIETQARGQRNMSPFLETYDEAKSYLTTNSPQDKWSAITDILSKALSNKPQR